MKTPLKSLLLCCLATLLWAVSCDKNEKPNGGSGTSDANFFSCEVNGVYWKAETPPVFTGPMAMQCFYDEVNGNLDITAIYKTKDQSRYEKIYISAAQVKGIGTYKMSVPVDIVKGFRDYNELNPCYIYYHDMNNIGDMEITSLDTNKRVIKGVFSVTLINKTCGVDSLMYITNGKFTANY